MSSDLEHSGLSSSVTPTSHPLVAEFTITAPADSTVEVQFGTDTSAAASSGEADPR